MKENKNSPIKKISASGSPTLKIVTDLNIATDFAKKVYQKFDKMIKSVVLFGSSVKEGRKIGSDLDIALIVDDASVKFDQELIAWYREELGKIIQSNPYKKELHITTIKLTTWMQDLLRGDPVVINIIRYGEEIIDFGGFFRPLKILLQEGKIKSTPEAIYTALERAPMHLVNSKNALFSSVEGIYWSMVDSAHAALMSANISPPSPEKIAGLLKEVFSDSKKLDSKYVDWFADVHILHKGIIHGEIREVKGVQIDSLQEKARQFVSVMTDLIKENIK